MEVPPPWYSRKPYIHFDLPLSPGDANAYVTDPEKVARHAFYPLLKYELLAPRVVKSPPGSAKAFVKEPKSRRIAYPAHKDGYIFSFYKSILEKPYEKWLTENGLGETVTAFRSTGENNVKLAKKAFDFIKADPNCRIVVTDVESFFDNLDHKLLKQIWSRFLGCSRLPQDHYAVYRAIARYSYVERHKAYNLFRVRLSGRLNKANSPKRLCNPKQFRDKVIGRNLIQRGTQEGIGIPQGTSLSPLLSNMYMADLDLSMSEWTESLGGRYWRYCDDILAVLPGESGPNVLQELDSQLESLNLKRNQQKTSILLGNSLSPQVQLQYLGLVFDGHDSVIRTSSIHRYRRKIRESIRLTENRQFREGHNKPGVAPFRKQALYNMYSEKPLRGKRVNARVRRRKHKGNFTHYMSRAANHLDSSRLARQRRRELRKFRDRLKQHS